MNPLRTVAAARDEALRRPVHDARTAAILGIALGCCFLVCFLTGLYSHLQQHPVGWLPIPPRPASLYRVTQGLHVATGFATVPLLLAKLWSVYPRLFRWPPVSNAAHAVERLMLVPLVCGAVFQLFSGVANVSRWYPWGFYFPAAHYWVAWITIGALVAHVGAKASVARAALSRPGDPVAAAAPCALGRRGFLGAVAAAAGVVTVTTAGQTLTPLRPLTLFAQRRPDIGVQGLPVNRSAVQAGVVEAAGDPGFRLRVTGAVAGPVELTAGELDRLARREAELPIACVEGWSASARWRGVPVTDLLAAAGADVDDGVTVRVESLQAGGRYRASELNHLQVRDLDTMLAVALNGERLDLDHGYPCRLIAPNRAGVLQTKWVHELVVIRA
ncbi:molybdopterin-dependent oxidoreductase [Jiangella alkaliphila]|uniref:Oxidoreductase molybdopterin binding domain-containing protein n=1 Tax=Jiangella alkaliphila TaxID=419479 RepID=A0A1H2LB51_9ACTN|nr:molybdopterin-dependent oxidoreductase [Jiangella alkaliphila]SDU78032.1 Oxidoreductase molybdopterin binding domain-containing protein [Jiangella alkaliphila]